MLLFHVTDTQGLEMMDDWSLDWSMPQLGFEPRLLWLLPLASEDKGREGFVGAGREVWSPQSLSP